MNPPPARGNRRSPVAVLVALALVVSGLSLVAALANPAGAASSDEQAFLSLINQLRASHGLGALTVDANLTALAQAHTADMASSQHLYHTPSLPAGVTENWEKLGENVGFGSNLNLIWNAFLNSPEHYANLTDPAFNAVGVGVVIDGNGVMWTTHRFEQVAAPAPPPFVPPAPPPTTARPRVVVTAPPTTAAPRRAVAPTTTPTTAAVPPTTAPSSPPEPEPAPTPANPANVSSLLDALELAG